MDVQWVSITPEKAERYLEKNNHNRKLRASVVGRYARDMTEGRWKRHHQGIAFNCDGTLVDGQHRLAAIIKSGCTVEMLVVRGVDMSAQIVVDDHAKRNAFDALTIADSVQHAITRNHVSIASAMMNNSTSAYYKDATANKQVMVEFINANYEIIDFGAELLRLHSTKRYISQATTMAVLSRAAHKHDRQRLREFWEVFYSGEMKSSKDVAAITLRNYVLTHGNMLGGGNGRKNLYSRAQRMVKAFLDGEELRKCYSIDYEAFPIPSDSVKE